jgi:HAMP domain-containing protein
LHFEKDAAVQQAIQRSTDEIAQLKHTAGNLRDELESARYQLEEEVQKMRLQNQNEIQHLKQTVEKLRDELETKHA